ncbi:MAG: hypothetical protein WBV80_23460 [Mycobacterium sp.]
MSLQRKENDDGELVVVLYQFAFPRFTSFVDGKDGDDEACDRIRA